MSLAILTTIKISTQLKTNTAIILHLSTAKSNKRAPKTRKKLCVKTKLPKSNYLAYTVKVRF